MQTQRCVFVTWKDCTTLVETLAIEHFCSECLKKAPLLWKCSLCQTEQLNLKVYSTSAIKAFSF